MKFDVVFWYDVLGNDAIYNGIIGMVQNGIIWRYMIWYDMIWYDMILYDMMSYSIWYDTT